MVHMDGCGFKYFVLWFETHRSDRPLWLMLSSISEHVDIDSAPVNLFHGILWHNAVCMLEARRHEREWRDARRAPCQISQVLCRCNYNGSTAVFRFVERFFFGSVCLPLAAANVCHGSCKISMTDVFGPPASFRCRREGNVKRRISWLFQ